MWLRAIPGALLCLIGAVWIGQGVGVIKGSAMTDHLQYAVLGAVVIAIGVALLVWANRIRTSGTTE
jgi:hypothetical protein